MAVFSTTRLLLLIFFIRVNCADDYDDVTTHRPQQNEDDVTRGQKSFDDVGGGVKTKFLNVLERKLKTQRVGGEGVSGGEEVAGVQVPGSEVKRSRSWAENTMYAWGKRQRQPTLSPPRAKRSTAPHRRRWSDHSMSSWGRKRSLTAPGNEEELRREETGGVDDWLQRGNNGDGEVETGPEKGRPSSHRRAAVQKRRWSEHSMSVWGKRRIPTTRGPGYGGGGGEDDKAAAVDPENETDAESHFLNQGTSYPALSNRGPRPLYFALLNQRNGAPKRNWATNTMNVWGKRSTPQKIQG